MRFQALSHPLKTDPTHKALVSNEELTTILWGDEGESYMIRHPAINNDKDFRLLLSGLLFSHGSLGLPLPLSEPFPKAATDYLLLSSSEKFSSLLNFFIKVWSWCPGKPAFFQQKWTSFCGIGSSKKSTFFFQVFPASYFTRICFVPSSSFITGTFWHSFCVLSQLPFLPMLPPGLCTKYVLSKFLPISKESPLYSRYLAQHLELRRHMNIQTNKWWRLGLCTSGIQWVWPAGRCTTGVLTAGQGVGSSVRPSSSCPSTSSAFSFYSSGL